MHYARVSDQLYYQKITHVGHVTQEKRSVHIQHGLHCLLVSPYVEGVTLLQAGLNLVTALYQAVVALQHSADCYVVARGE